MANLEFSRQEIESLARKLSEVMRDLSERETELLLAIFAAAAERATPVGLGGGAALPAFEIRIPPGEGRDEALTDLRAQLLNAYVPGNEPSTISTFKVVGTPIGWPPPPPPPPDTD
ncbi:MAG: hypothetical protein JO037_00965 [Actinobacteria bacterium]|nr:hypothetical protein [Actinomycetota bacterium]